MSAGKRSAPVSLHLHIHARAGCEAKLLDFLRRARPFYEAPGGVRVRLLQDATDPHRFVEIIEYRDHAAYLFDDQRVRTDPEMQRYLEEWRTLLEREPKVMRYVEITDEIKR